MTTQLLRWQICRLATALFALTFFLHFSAVLQAQIQWQNTLGGNSAEEWTSTCPTSDGGSVVATSTWSSVSGNITDANNGNSDAWITKLDANGTIQWQNNLGGSESDAPYAIKQTADGGYIVAIHSMSGVSGDKTGANRGTIGANGDYWMVKLDALGAIQWEKTIGGAGDDIPSSLDIVSGGYIIGGHSASSISGEKTQNSQGDYDFWLVKIDLNGNIIWDKTHGFNGMETLMSLQATTDGGYILGGYAYQTTNSGLTTYGVIDMLVIKTDANGDMVWQKMYGGSSEDYLTMIRQNSDGSYIITGVSSSPISGIKSEGFCGGQYDIWVLKINDLGNLIWENTIATNNYESAIMGQETADGGFLFVGSTEGGIHGDKTLSSKGGTDYWVIKTNVAGVLEWQKVFGGSDSDFAYSAHLLSNGEILIAGTSYSPISGDKTGGHFGDGDIWIVKTGNSVPTPTPSVSQLNLCQNSVAAPLTAVGQNLLWYTTQTGGIGSPIAPIPSTAMVGTTSYFVSQTVNGIESPLVELKVIVSVAPTAFITGNSNRCSYSTGTTTLSTTANAGFQYLWSTGATGSYIAVNPSVSTTYSVTVTNANGCTATASFVLNVVNINAQITAPNSFCRSVPTALTASGGTNYLWSTGHTAATISQSLQNARTYTVTVSQNGCSRTASKTVTVDQPFNAQITNLNNNYTQSAAPVTLTGTPVGGTFTIDNVSATVLNPATLTLGFHTVRYTVTQGACTATKAKVVGISAPVQNLSVPTTTYFNAKLYFNSVKLDWVNTSVNESDYFIVQRKNEIGEFIDIQLVNAKFSDKVNDVNAFVAQDDQPTEGENVYRVKTVLSDGTVQLSALKSVKFNKTANVLAFPNPASDALDIRLDSYLGKSVSLSFYNSFGQMVLTQNILTVQNAIEHLDISQLSSGIYQMRVVSSNKRDAVVKVVVNK